MHEAMKPFPLNFLLSFLLPIKSVSAFQKVQQYFVKIEKSIFLFNEDKDDNLKN